MKIHLEQQYIGAALMQIAEHPQFTAINKLKVRGEAINNGFLINGDIAVFCKYASEPTDSGEYVFTFNSEHMNNIRNVQRGKHNIFFALVCVKDTEICCLTEKQFDTLIENRKKSARTEEEHYQILVSVPTGKSLRAYVNAAKTKGKSAGKALIIKRNAFPEAIFGKQG